MVDEQNPFGTPQHPDAAAMQGGPEGSQIGSGSDDGAPAPAGAKPPASEPAKPATKKVKLGEREFDLPADAADALSAYASTTNSAFAELRAQVQALSKPAVPSKSDEPEDYDYSVKLFEDPNEALSRHERRILEQVEERIKAARGEVEATTNADRFWRGFYESNPALKRVDHFVRSVLQRDWSEFETLPTADASTRLAERVSSELLSLGVKLDKGEGGDVPRVEGAGPPAAPPPAAPGDNKVVTLADTLRKRARQRQGSRTGSTG